MKKQVFLLILLVLFSVNAFAINLFGGITEDFKSIGKKANFSDLTKTVQSYQKKLDEQKSKIQKAKPEKRTELQEELEKALNTVDENGFTPVFYAVMAGNENLLKDFLESGSKTNFCPENKTKNPGLQGAPLLFWALHEAKSRNRLEIIKILLENSNDCAFKLNNDFYINYTPLLAALENSQNSEVIRLVIEKTPKDTMNTITAKRKNSDELTPLIYLCWNFENLALPFSEKSVLFENLLSFGTNANETGKINGRKVTPLFALVKSEKNNFDAQIKLLLKNGANVNEECEIIDLKTGKNWVCTPFQYVARKNNIALYELFKENNGNKVKTDNFGKSALDYISDFAKTDADKLNILYEGDTTKISAQNFIKNYSGNWDSVTSSAGDGKNFAQVAMSQGDEKTAIGLLENHISWEKSDLAGKNSLDYAAQKNLQSVLNYLSEKLKSDKIPIGKSIFSILDNALLNGDVKILQDFLGYDSYKNVSQKYGFYGTEISPVVYAAITENPEISDKNRLLVLEILCSDENKRKFGAQGLNDSITKDGKPPLLLAKDQKIILNLLNFGANETKQDNAHLNVIDRAFQENQSLVIEYFKNKENFKIGTSLFYAIENTLSGNESYLPDFIKKMSLTELNQLKTDLPSGDGSSGVVFYAIYAQKSKNLSGERQKIIKILLESGLSVDEKVVGGNFAGKTPLIFAAESNDFETVKFLLDNGADSRIACKGENAGRTALAYSLENKNKKMYALLSERQGKLEDVRFSGKEDKNATLLMFVARYADGEFVRELLQEFLFWNKDCLEKTDSDGNTPFLYAAKYNDDTSVMKYLRMYGANINVKNRAGETAVTLASGNEAKTKQLNAYGVYE